MSDRQSRDRAEAKSRQLERSTPGPTTGDRFVGRVIQVDSAKTLGAGLYCLVNAVDIGGPEVEGGPITRTVVGTTPIPVAILDGTPVVGDDLIVRRVTGGRWEARKAGPSSPPSGGIVPPNCFCTNVPPVLTMIATPGPNADQYTASIIQSSTLNYVATAADAPPSYPTQFNSVVASWVSGVVVVRYAPSTNSPYGSSTRAFYSLRCSLNQFQLSIYYDNGSGGWNGGFPVATWIIGTGNNACDPFSLCTAHDDGAYFATGGNVTINCGGSSSPTGPAMMQMAAPRLAVLASSDAYDSYRPTPYGIYGRNIYLDADLCPLGEGPCGCGPEPRHCRLGQGAEVHRADCLACQTGRVVEVRGHTVAYSGYGYLMMTLARLLETEHQIPVLIRPMTHDPDGMIPIDDFIRARLIR